MYLSELIEMDEKQLRKVSKDDLVKTILNSKWQWKSNVESVTKADARLVEQSKGELAAKTMLVGYLGITEPMDEYSGRIKIDDLDLCNLIGQLMCKASRY